MYFVHPQIKLSKLLKAKLALMKSPDTEKLVQKLSILFPQKQFIFTDMGRTAFRLIIEKFNLQNAQILLPAYICDIFYPIFKEYNIKPIFLDIDLSTFHVQLAEIKQKISTNIKAILICHTYGLPIDIGTIREIVGRNVIIILSLPKRAVTIRVISAMFPFSVFISNSRRCGAECWLVPKIGTLNYRKLILTSAILYLS